MKTQRLKERFESIADGEKLAGVVQNPQPVIFSTTMDVDSTTTSRLTELVSEMGAPESMKLYTIRAVILPAGTAFIVNNTINDGGLIVPPNPCWASGYVDMDLSIFVGNNRVPHRPIDLATINASAMNEIVLTTPIFVEWSQRIYIQVQNNDPQAPGTTGNVGPPAVPGSVSRVKVTLVGEVVDEVELRRRLERQANAQQKAQQQAQGQ